MSRYAEAVAGVSGVRRVLAPNPGPMTLEGTNTWVLEPPGAGGAVIVDPGPDARAHRDAVQVAVEATERGRAAAIVLTHHHADHAEAAQPWSRWFGVPVETAEVSGLLRLPTPGHTADSVTFRVVLPSQVSGAVAVYLTGDTVLGRGSTVLARPDGSLSDYLASLRTLATMVGGDLAAGVAVRLLPGHGPVPPDAAAWIAQCLRHREQRLEQVRRAVDAGARDAAAVVDRVYPDLDPSLRAAAWQSAQAQLQYLRERGDL